MEPKFLNFSPNTSLSTTTLPLFLSYKSPFIKTPKISHLSFSRNPSIKTSFWGNSLVLPEKYIGYFSDLRKTRVGFEPIRALVKRRKEIKFDNVVQRDKKLSLVLKIRSILVRQPDRIMSLMELGKYRKELGLTQTRRFISLLKKYPAVFEIVEEGIFSLKFKLTSEAEKLYLEELECKSEMEDLLVIKLRKLLMMSLDKRILLEKITHLRMDLGLPLEYCDTICHRYPQYFKVVLTGRGLALELTHWDPNLAISTAECAEENNRDREMEKVNLITDRPPKSNRVKQFKGLNFSKSVMRKVCQFRDLPYICPYSDFSELQAGSPEKEKHACGVIHEMLSLTIEKRTLVDHITHFREEFRFSQQIRGMLSRHPDLFYVSLKGDRDSIFLRDAYRDSHLIEKDRLILFKEKLRGLVTVPRFPKRGSLRRDVVGQEGTDNVEDGESSDNLMSDDGFDTDGDDHDDDDDDTPPDFDEYSGDVKLGPAKEKKHENSLANNEEQVLEPVVTDGRLRECW